MTPPLDQEMQSLYHPSQALLVSESTPLEKCLFEMKRQSSRSVLTLADATNEPLIGIFTETDMVLRHNLFKIESSWIKPIRTYMTKGVKVVPLLEMSRASVLMAKYNARTLPIVKNLTGPVYKRHILGVINAWDLVVGSVEHQKLLGVAKKPKINLLLLSKNKKYETFLENSLQPYAEVRVSISNTCSTQDLENLRRHTALLIDLDSFKLEESIPILKILFKTVPPTPIILLLDENLYSNRFKSIIRIVEKASHFLVFQKPINPSELFQAVLLRTDQTNKL